MKAYRLETHSPGASRCLYVTVQGRDIWITSDNLSWSNMLDAVCNHAGLEASLITQDTPMTLSKAEYRALVLTFDPMLKA